MEQCKHYDPMWCICKLASCKHRDDESVKCPIKDTVQTQWNG